MTIEELAKRVGGGLTLRHFDLAPQPHADKSQYEGKAWRAAISGAYFTSDTFRLALGDSDANENEGWGTTPDEAVDALVAALLERASNLAEGSQKHADEAKEKYARLTSMLLPDALPSRPTRRTEP